MKKTVAMTCILFVMFLAVSAEAGIGFKGGMNFTKWTGDDWQVEDDYSWKPGYKFGAFLTLPVSPIMQIQPEVYYTSKGWQADGDFDGEEMTLTFNTNYIEVPVLLKLNMSTPMTFAPSIFAGPYVGFMLGDPTWEIEYGGESEEMDANRDDFNTMDIGGVVGAAFDYSMATTTLTVEARYNMGFTSIIKEEDGEEYDVKNMGFSLMAGLSF